MVHPKTKQIIDYYDARVTEHRDSGHSTLLDDNLRKLEIETVENWLTDSDRVLEIFCGNGLSTLEFAKRCKSVVACDLSEKMIESAKRNLAGRKPSSTNVTFEKQDVLEIDKAYSPGQFDTVVSVRGLINLPSFGAQKEAILKVHGLLPKRGKFIFLEGYRNGLERINDLRAKFSLKPLSEPWYDRYFEDPELSDFLGEHFDVGDERNLDMYFLVSRVLYPHAVSPAEPEFSNVCNTVARLLLSYARTDEGTTLMVCRCLIKK